MQQILTADDRSRINQVVALPLRDKTRLAWQLRGDPRVPALMTLPLGLVIVYVLLPFHVFPRRWGVLRRFDDLIVAVAGLWLFVKLIPNEVLDEHLKGLEKR